LAWSIHFVRKIIQVFGNHPKKEESGWFLKWVPELRAVKIGALHQIMSQLKHGLSLNVLSASENRWIIGAKVFLAAVIS
jgi:hypothetical protein